MQLAEIAARVTEKYPEVRFIPADVEQFVFEKRVRLQCFYCGRYGVNWRCPPHLPELDYPAIFREYPNAALAVIDLPVTPETFSEVRVQSTQRLHRALLEAESALWESGAPMCQTFIGGSCKLCRNGCAKDTCRNPYQSRSPLEAAGVNVVATAAKFGLKVEFPVRTHMMRVGLLLW